MFIYSDSYNLVFFCIVKLDQTISTQYLRDFKNPFVSFHHSIVQGSVCAYVPKPGSDLKLMSRSTADRTLIVVNERPVHIKELVKVSKVILSVSSRTNIVELFTNIL